jgi:hypothetical protein
MFSFYSNTHSHIIIFFVRSKNGESNYSSTITKLLILPSFTQNQANTSNAEEPTTTTTTTAANNFLQYNMGSLFDLQESQLFNFSTSEDQEYFKRKRKLEIDSEEIKQEHKRMLLQIQRGMVQSALDNDFSKVEKLCSVMRTCIGSLDSTSDAHFVDVENDELNRT